MSDAHRCLARSACCRAEVIDKKRHGAPTDHPETLCDACFTRIESAIRQLPRDWSDLRAAIGERATVTGQRVHSTPTPAIPISPRKEALMSAIVETADRAAGIIAELLNTEQPTGRRTTAPAISIDRRDTFPRAGTPADTAEQTVRPPDEQLLAAAIAIIEPNIDLLATAPEDAHNLWAKPRRCERHTSQIEAVNTYLEDAKKPDDIAYGRDLLRRAYAAAGACDECNGWNDRGQARELVELTGTQIALQLADLHHQTRAELGKTRLRHTYTMPCPDCGARVFRNDGESIVQCEGDSKHTCTEREYKVRAGLRTEERTWTEILKYLLAESYWRLDRIRGLVDILEKDKTIDTDPRVGRIILDHLKEILAAGPAVKGTQIGHQRPKQRASGTDRRAALQRQVDEDTWAWRNESPYQKPERKPRHKATRPAGAPNIHPSSLAGELVDLERDYPMQVIPCAHCNTYHAGECA